MFWEMNISNSWPSTHHCRNYYTFIICMQCTIEYIVFQFI